MVEVILSALGGEKKEKDRFFSFFFYEPDREERERERASRATWLEAEVPNRVTMESRLVFVDGGMDLA